MPIFVDFYGPEEAPEAKELGEKSPKSSTMVEGTPYPPRHATYFVADSETPPDLFPMPKSL